jgi:hypothetical protein
VFLSQTKTHSSPYRKLSIQSISSILLWEQCPTLVCMFFIFEVTEIISSELGAGSQYLNASSEYNLFSNGSDISLLYMKLKSNFVSFLKNGSSYKTLVLQ